MTPLKKVFFSLLFVIIFAAVVGLFLPRQSHVERSILINSTAEKIFPNINSMTAFQKWSPWVNPETPTEYRFEGPKQGLGSKMIWISQSENVADGYQVIIKSIPNEMVETTLDFGDENTGRAVFELSDENGKTRVTWHFYTDSGWDIFNRYIGYFVLDGMLGRSYDRGLLKLQLISSSKVN